MTVSMRVVGLRMPATLGPGDELTAAHGRQQASLCGLVPSMRAERSSSRVATQPRTPPADRAPHAPHADAVRCGIKSM